MDLHSNPYRRWLSAIALALLALEFLSPSLRSVYGLSNGENASTVIGEPDYTSTVNPSGGLRGPSNFAFDSSGNLWVADSGNNRVVEETNVGTANAAIKVVLGQASLNVGIASLSQNGIDNPSALVLDTAGNLWLTDTTNNRVLEFAAPLTSGESATTVLGQPDLTTRTLQASQSGLNFPAGIALDSSGNLWIADSSNNRVVEFKAPFTNGKAASLVLGQPNLASTVGYATLSGLNFPTAVRFDSSGNLWVADGGNNRILEYKGPFANGMNASIVMGQANFTASSPKTTQAGLTSPGSVAFDSSGNLWVADTFNNRVVEYAKPFSNGMQASLTLGQPSFNSSAAATTKTGMHEPTEVGFDKAGNLWVADASNNRVLEFASPFSSGASPSYLLGQSDYTSNLSGGKSSLAIPTSVTFDSKGDLWAADTLNNRVVEYAPPLSTDMNAALAIGQASITLSNSGGNKNGLALPFGVATDGSGDLWVSDSGNNRVLEFTPPFTTGMNAALVIGQPSFTSYANVTSPSGLNFPSGLAFDSSGNLWVADAGNSRVLEFIAPFASGMAASLVLGQPGFTLFAPGASQSRFYSPFGVASDPLGDIFVADTGNSRVLEFVPPFTNYQLASLVIGQANFTTRTTAVGRSSLDAPEGVAVDRHGSLWVADYGNSRVLEFAAPLATGASASVVLGQGTFNDNSRATSQAGMILPQGLALDAAGNVWAADTTNNRLLEFPSTTSSTSKATSTTSSTSLTTSSSTSSIATSRSTTSTSATSTTSQTFSVPGFPVAATAILIAISLIAVLVYVLARRGSFRGFRLGPKNAGTS